MDTRAGAERRSGIGEIGPGRGLALETLPVAFLYLGEGIKTPNPAEIRPIQMFRLSPVAAIIMAEKTITPITTKVITQND